MSGLTEADVLNHWIKELDSLKPFYEQVQKVWNKKMLDIRSKDTSKRNVNDFVLSQSNHFFSRSQIQNFFREEKGISEDCARTRIKNFCKRKAGKMFFISKNLFDNFIDHLIEMIKEYGHK